MRGSVPLRGDSAARHGAERCHSHKRERAGARERRQRLNGAAPPTVLHSVGCSTGLQGALHTARCDTCTVRHLHGVTPDTALYGALYYKDPHPPGPCTAHGSAAPAALWLDGSTGLSIQTSPAPEQLRSPPSPASLKLTAVWRRAPCQGTRAARARPRLPLQDPAGPGASQSGLQLTPGGGIQYHGGISQGW